MSSADSSTGSCCRLFGLIVVLVSSFCWIDCAQLSSSSNSGSPSAAAASSSSSNSGSSIVGSVGASSSSSVSGVGSKKDARCEEITIPMCRGIGYNWTSMPNSLHHETQEEAGLEVHQFWPLVEIQCSPDMRFFLCSIYAPICIQDYPTSIPSCKSVCLRAEAGCAPLMRKYGFAWPERMQCDKFPNYGDPLNLCMDARNGTLPPPTVAPPPNQLLPEASDVPDQRASPKRPVTVPPPKMCKGPNKRLCLPSSVDDLSGSAPSGTSGSASCDCQCRAPLVQISPSDWLYNRSASLSVGGVANCMMPCANPFFSDDEQWFASLWIALWAAIAALSSALTFATFLIDRPRFRYPERPLIFLSACYVGLSLGYLVRIVVGGREEVACDGNVIRYGAAPSLVGGVGGGFVGVSSSTSSPSCVVTFLLVYFFGQAAGLWWVILSLTWFLAAGRKWGSEAIARCSPYFHLVAWTIPAVQTAAALLMAAVDGDSLAGICHVGVQQTTLLRWLVLFPLGLHLLLGGGFLLAGLAGLARIRRVLKEQGRPKAEKLEKLMIRIGIFSVLYSVPAGILLGCYAYEVAFHVEWGRTLTCSGPACGEPQSYQSRPDFSIFMLKYFMTLVVGITSGFWIWSHKTLDSWRKFYCRLCHTRPKSALVMSAANGGQQQQQQQSASGIGGHHHHHHHHQVQQSQLHHAPFLQSQSQQQQHQQQQQQLMTPPLLAISSGGPQHASVKSASLMMIKQPLMQSVQSHLGSGCSYKAPPLSHV